jgi:hypothetical protein
MSRALAHRRIRTIALPLLALLAVPMSSRQRGAGAAEAEHTIVNVVNGLVYVDYGTRDGVAAGQKLEVVGIGIIRLEMCGEVICRAKIPSKLEGVLARGMRVRPIGADTTPTETAPAPSTTPSPSPSITPSIEPPVAAKKKKPPTSILTNYGPIETAPPTVIETSPSTETETSPSTTPTTEPTVVTKKKKKVPASFWTPPAPEPTSAPARLDYVEGLAAPHGYRVVAREHQTAVRVGWATLGIAYGLSLLSGAGAQDGGGIMLLPVLGPWLHVAGTTDANSNGRINTGVAVFEGLGQVAGVIALAVGYGTKERYYLRDDLKAQLHVTPIAGASFGGIAAFGSF